MMSGQAADTRGTTLSAAVGAWPVGHSLTAKEAARVAGVHERTIRRAIARGDLAATKRARIFQITPEALAQFQARRQHASSPPLLLRLVEPALGPAVALPTRLTPFLGRERDIEAIDQLLSTARLLTLTGPGGIGKTRLALRVAEELTPHFADGVAFVPLAAVTAASLIPAAIAEKLGVREHGGRPISDRLVAALRDQQLLLVLDNFEHVLPAGPFVADLLASCARLTILVTSRTTLRLSGEHRFPVPPMGLPEPAATATAAAAHRADAVQLFVARAQAAQPGFALTDDNASAIAAICRRLDGLPLAIELAAARSSVLPPQALRDRLERRLPLLTGGPRDAPHRLRTMHDAIAWSYDFLSPDAQALFRRLAVCAGGWTLEAAEVIGRIGDSPAIDVLAVLSSLVEHSLVQPQEGADRGPDPGTPRFAMLETIREFALERLLESGEQGLAQAAHAAYFTAFAERYYPYRIGPGEHIDDRLGRVEVEHPNLRAALTRMADDGDAEGVLQLAGALVVFWYLRGHFREARRWLEWALAHTAEIPTTLRSRALAGLGYMVWFQGHHAQAAVLAEAGLAIAEQIGDKDLAARALHMLGLVAEFQCRWDQAGLYMERALDLWRELGMMPEVAMVLNGLSVVAYGLGDAGLSGRRAEESLALTRALGHAFGSAIALPGLARLARDRGDDRRATVAFQESLHLWASIGDRETIVQPLAGLAELASVHDQPETAATLVGAIDALAQEAGDFILERCMRFAGDNGDRAAARACAALGEGRFADLRAAGRALSLEEAIAVAATVTIPVRRTTPFPAASPLTAREHDVLRLVAAGQTDREIADALFLSLRTVNTHVAHILAKLDVATRRAAAMWAREHSAASEG
jgi:non-specific serine/threonine protein kinase